MSEGAQIAEAVEYVRFTGVLKILGEQHRELASTTSGDWDLNMFAGIGLLEVSRTREVHVEGKGQVRRKLRCWVPFDKIDVMQSAVEEEVLAPVQPAKKTPAPAPPLARDMEEVPVPPATAFVPGAQAGTKPAKKTPARKPKTER